VSFLAVRPSRRIWRPLFAAVAGLAVVGAGTVAGFTQLENNFPNSPVTCNDTTYPCIEWPKTGSNLSVNVDIYLASSLNQNIDLRTDMRNSFDEWNAVAARNPHLQETTSTTSEDVWVWAEPLASGIWGGTNNSSNVSSPYHIYYSYMVFSSAVTWNRSYAFDATHADARKVTNHENGHLEGLGHTSSSSPAIMHQGATDYYRVKDPDRSGIIDIYGAYP
jgi:hypothetical protein